VPARASPAWTRTARTSCSKRAARSRRSCTAPTVTGASTSAGGPLRAEATGRLLEALQRSGQRDKARSVAKQYFASYPRGAQATLAAQLQR